MKKLTFIGAGYVGLVTGACFAEMGNSVIVCDIDKTKIEKLQRGEIPFHEPGLSDLVYRNRVEGRLSFSVDVQQSVQESDVVFIAVGTPMKESGEVDVSYIHNVAQTIGQSMNGYKIIVTKSTVPVGTCRVIEAIIRKHLVDPELEFHVVSNPEFLREGSAIHDCFHMERAVIGSDDLRATDEIVQLHKPFETKVLVTDLETAEMIKYASNAFLATKISFMNEIANICDRTGADVTKVAEGMGLDSRIGKKFLQAGIGFGGSCFPKDTEALRHIALKVGYRFRLLESVIATNVDQRTRFIEKIKETLFDLNGINLAILGLSFKPDTDDMRSAPSLFIIPALISMGAKLKLYDPVAIETAKLYLGHDLTYTNDIYEAIEGCDACIILTEWKNISQMNISKVKGLMKSPIIIDGRNCLSLEEMRIAGIQYVSIGRPQILASQDTVVV